MEDLFLAKKQSCKIYFVSKDIPNSYLAMDDIEIGHLNRIPLWMFGLLY